MLLREEVTEAMSSPVPSCPMLAAVAFAIACGVKPAPQETQTQEKSAEPQPGPSEPDEPTLIPSWVRGTCWEIRYRYLVPNPAKLRDPPPRHEETDWRYCVKDDAGGRVRVTAVELDEYPRSWRMVFATTGELLELRPPDGRAPSMRPGPFVPSSPGLAWHLTPAWPAFPLRLGQQTFEQDALSQRIATDAAVWTITLDREGDEARMERARTIVQHWEPGRPWWSSVTINERSTYRGQTHDTRTLEGRVTTWSPNPAPPKGDEVGEAQP